MAAAAALTLTSKGACQLPLQASTALVAAIPTYALLLHVQCSRCCCRCIARAMPCTKQPSCIVQHTAMTTHRSPHQSPHALLCPLRRWPQTWTCQRSSLRKPRGRQPAWW
jgi:hypothetical protein